MLLDLHMHSRYSFDGRSGVADYCKAAETAGLSKIAVTDHCDFVDRDAYDRTYLARADAREAEFSKERTKWADRLTLYNGLELGNPSWREKEADRLLREHAYDFVLGAVHYLEPGDVGVDFHPDSSDFRGIEAFFARYGAEIGRLLDFGGFDSLAHIDYPLRFFSGAINDCVEACYRAYAEPILARLVRQNLALEVNTRRLFGRDRCPGPGMWVLSRYRALGGSLLTVGSDAHEASQAGRGIAEALTAIRAAGFSAVTAFDARKPIRIPLSDAEAHR